MPIIIIIFLQQCALIQPLPQPVEDEEKASKCVGEFTPNRDPCEIQARVVTMGHFNVFKWAHKYFRKLRQMY